MVSKGQEPIEYLLMLLAVLVIVAIAVYFTTTSPDEGDGRDYFTIEGRIVEVKTGDMLILIWENDDGRVAIRFRYTSEFLPIDENIELTYYHTSYGSRIIESVVKTEGRRRRR